MKEFDVLKKFTEASFKLFLNKDVVLLDADKVDRDYDDTKYVIYEKVDDLESHTQKFDADYYVFEYDGKFSYGYYDMNHTSNYFDVEGDVFIESVDTYIDEYDTIRGLLLHLVGEEIGLLYLDTELSINENKYNF